MDEDEMVKELAKSAQAFAEPIGFEPIDFEKLIKDGVLMQKGRSYCVQDMKLLPEKVSKRIKTATPTKNGLRVTFYKESKSLKKLAGQLSEYLE